MNDKQYFTYKYNHKYTIDIHIIKSTNNNNNITHAIYCNNKPFKYKKTYVKRYTIYNKLLCVYGIVLNIKTNYTKNKRYKHNKIPIDNIILTTIERYNTLMNQQQLFKVTNTVNTNKELQQVSKTLTPYKQQVKLVSMMSMLFVVGIVVLVLVFVVDYQSIKTKINHNSLLKKEQLLSEYNANNCKERGNLQAIKGFCDNIQTQIKLIENEYPTTISIFITWILDIFTSSYSALGITNVCITLIVIFLFKKFI